MKTTRGIRRCKLSECGRYRYDLCEGAGTSSHWALWVMLNPSTADASADDATVRKVRRFTELYGFDGWAICNLFALRATDPKELHRCVRDEGVSAAIGPENDNWIMMRAQREHGRVIVAWGAHGQRYRQRVSAVVELLGGPLLCLGTTSDGAPRHPLMLSYDTPLVAWGGGQ